MNLNPRTGLLPIAVVATVAVTAALSLGLAAYAANNGSISWVRDLKEARAQAGKKKRPIFIFWKQTAAKPAPLPAAVVARSKQFICVQLDFQKDKAEIKQLGIDVHDPDSNTARWRMNHFHRHRWHRYHSWRQPADRGPSPGRP